MTRKVTSMKIENLKLGMKVEVNDSSVYYQDWKGIVSEVSGVEYKNGTNIVDITLRENQEDGGSDGWTAEELTEIKS